VLTPTPQLTNDLVRLPFGSQDIPADSIGHRVHVEGNANGTTEVDSTSQYQHWNISRPCPTESTPSEPLDYASPRSVAEANVSYGEAARLKRRGSGGVDPLLAHRADELAVFMEGCNVSSGTTFDAQRRNVETNSQIRCERCSVTLQPTLAFGFERTWERTGAHCNPNERALVWSEARRAFLSVRGQRNAYE
jgi:hypothetical protein